MDYKNKRMKILDLLAKGELSIDEAEVILDALDQKEKKTSVEMNPSKKQFKMLKIFIASNDREKVNLSIPLDFVRLLRNKKFSAVIKNSNTEIDVEEIINLAQSGVMGELVNIETPNGDIVRITIE
ncbi:MAG TPA: hypothetical protein GXZ79_03615 [Acholeplasma sp.]|jgi:hypothetical protein|nr:hypothetical protein [Acholeplasma sp.]